MSQLWALAETVPARYKALVLLASAITLRSAELAALRRRNVDLDACTLRVDPDEGQYVEPEDRPPYFGAAEVGCRRADRADSRGCGRCARRASRPACAAGPDGLLFTTRDGAPVSRHNRSWWRRACRVVGAAPGTHLHDLRRAGLTLAAQSGATLRELMILAGHSTPRAAMVYQHASRERAVRIAAGISDLLERRPNAGATGT